MKAACLPPQIWPFPVGGDDTVPEDYEPTDAQLGGAVTDPYDSPSYTNLTYSKGPTK